MHVYAMPCIVLLLYIAGKFGVCMVANPLQFAKLKPFKLVVTINNPMADLHTYLFTKLFC